MLKFLRALGVNTDEASRKLDLSFARAGISSADAPVHYLFFSAWVQWCCWH